MIRAALALGLLAVAPAASAQLTFEPEESAPAQPDAGPQAPPDAPAPPPKQEESWAPPVVDFRLVTRLAVDTAFEGQSENVASFYRFATASVRTQRGHLRLLFSARLRWVSTEEAPSSGPFWLFNGTRPRSQFEPTLGETSVSGTNAGVDWSAGLLDVAWGQNPAFSPADVLTPLDMRDGPLPTNDGRLPAPAVRARGQLGFLSWDAVYLPVFIPSKLPVIGNDWGPYALAVAPAIPDLQRFVDPTTFASVESSLSATQYPQLDLTAPQGGLRLTARPGPLVVAVSWSEFFDRQPILSVSPGFRQFLTGYVNGNELDQLGGALALEAERQQNISPMTSRFLRTRVFALDAALTTGPFRWTLDVGYSPQRVFPLPDLTSTVKPMVSGVAGFEWEGPPVIAAGVYSLLALNIPAGVRLLYLDPATVSADRTRSASFSIGYLVLRWRLLDDRLDVGVSGLVSFRADWFALPTVSWRFGDAHSLGLGANLMGGPSGGFGGAYRRNNEAYVQYVLTL